MLEDTRSMHATQLPNAICDLRKNDPCQKVRALAGPHLTTTNFAGLAADEAAEVRRIRVVSREDRVQIARAHVTRGYF